MNHLNHAHLAQLIDDAWENRAEINAQSATASLRDAIQTVINGLDAGELRVAENRQPMASSSVDQKSRPPKLSSLR